MKRAAGKKAKRAAPARKQAPSAPALARGARPRIDIAERRARLAVRHHIAPASRVKSVQQAARDMVALHSTDPASVYLSTWARVTSPTIAAVDDALYVERRLVRMLAMRRTLWVSPVEDAPHLHASCKGELARVERKRSEQLADMAGIKNASTWLKTVEQPVLQALAQLGEATTSQLTDAVPELQKKVRVAVGKKYEGQIGMGSRVLMLLAIEGKIVRARARGSWISGQYRWAPMEQWLGAELAPVSEQDARRHMVRRWLERFGPGTEADLRWWTGWTARAVRAALTELNAVEVDLDDGALGYVLPGDVEKTERTHPWVSLLPALDPTTMGWRDRAWYLGAHKAQLFDTNGNAGPTIWADGRIVGGWAIRKSGEVVTKLLEDIGRERERAVDAEAARLTKWLNASAAAPRFPTPLQKALTAGA